ncbi:MAG: VWA domain-containing protein [Phycisphaerae bacterium]|jgi:cobalamin biosynthesis protein CobT
MRDNPFESQLERLARTLTDQFGVRVTCQGDEAWTDGTQIVLPSLPEPLDDDLERLTVGFLDHELGHVAFSDFRVVEQFAKKHPGREGMLNVVEDALVERRAMERWPGVRGNLDAMFRQIRDRIARTVLQRDAFGQFCTAVYLKLSHHKDMLGLEHQVEGYDDLLDWFPAIGDTHGAAELAEQIMERWLKANPPAAQPQTPDACGTSLADDGPGNVGEGATGEEADDQPGQSPTDGGALGNGDQKGDDDDAGAVPSAGGEDDAQSDDADQRAGKTPEKQTAQIDADAYGRPPQTRAVESDASDGAEAVGASAGGQHGGSLITEVLTEAIAECVSRVGGSSDYRVFTKEFDHIGIVPAASESDLRALCEQHVDVVRRLRRGLTNALRSAEKRWWRDDQINGTLSPRTLHRLCMDRPRLDVFRTRAMVQGRSTAVSILLDASGSMTTKKMDVARDALRVLLEALADLKVATEALTFTTGNEFDLFKAGQSTGEDAARLRDRYSRFANLAIGVVKQFEEPVKQGLRRLLSIRGTGLTPLGEAMHLAARRLHLRPETRKILLVLTDGRAGCEARDDAAVRHAQHMTQRIENAGIELIGVGIMDESLRAIVADTIVVHQLQDLPAQLCKLLGRTLKGGLRHVG